MESVASRNLKNDFEARIARVLVRLAADGSAQNGSRPQEAWPAAGLRTGPRLRLKLTGQLGRWSPNQSIHENHGAARCLPTAYNTESAVIYRSAQCQQKNTYAWNNNGSLASLHGEAFL